MAGTKDRLSVVEGGAAATAAEAAETVEAVALADAGAAEDGAGPVLKKKDLVERAAAASGAKKKVAKDVVEAVLAELSAALSRGEDLLLPPLGRVRLVKHKPLKSGEMLTLRLRRGGAKAAGAGAGEEPGAGSGAGEGLAEPPREG